MDASERRRAVGEAMGRQANEDEILLGDITMETYENAAKNVGVFGEPAMQGWKVSENVYKDVLLGDHSFSAQTGQVYWVNYDLKICWTNLANGLFSVSFCKRNKQTGTWNWKSYNHGTVWKIEEGHKIRIMLDRMSIGMFADEGWIENGHTYRSMNYKGVWFEAISHRLYWLDKNRKICFDDGLGVARDGKEPDICMVPFDKCIVTFGHYDDEQGEWVWDHDSFALENQGFYIRVTEK